MNWHLLRLIDISLNDVDTFKLTKRKVIYGASMGSRAVKNQSAEINYWIDTDND